MHLRDEIGSAPHDGTFVECLAVKLIDRRSREDREQTFQSRLDSFLWPDHFGRPSSTSVTRVA